MTFTYERKEKNVVPGNSSLHGFTADDHDADDEIDDPREKVNKEIRTRGVYK